MKRVLITGAAGFVGGHFVTRFTRDRDVSVDVLDIAHGALSESPSGVTMHGMDCRRYFDLCDFRYDLVIHCAAIVGGRATIEGQPMAVATDLAVDADLWQWALRTRPGRVVYFSSSAAYPTHLQDGGVFIPNPDGGKPWRLGANRLFETHINYDHLATPDNTYGLAKLVGEIQAAHVRNEGVPVTVIRPFSGYGPGQTLDYPMPSFIDRAARRADPFDIWGDGQQTRDWVHIDDIVDLTMACVDQGIDGPVNACTGRTTSFDQLASIVTEQAGYSPTLAHHPDAPTGVRYRVGDPTLMATIWEPRISLEDGVAQALAAARLAA